MAVSAHAEKPSTNVPPSDPSGCGVNVALGGVVRPMATLSEAIEAALKHQQAGRFPQAERIYRQVLQQQPRLVDAWQLLGLLMHQMGRSETALEYINRAIALGGVRPELYNNLGS